jgi:hypothetical protein
MAALWCVQLEPIMYTLHLNQVRSSRGWRQHVPPKRLNKYIIIQDSSLIFSVGCHGQHVSVVAVVPLVSDQLKLTWRHCCLLRETEKYACEWRWHTVRIRRHPSPSGSLRADKCTCLVGQDHGDAVFPCTLWTFGQSCNFGLSAYPLTAKFFTVSLSRPLGHLTGLPSDKQNFPLLASSFQQNSS